MPLALTPSETRSGPCGAPLSSRCFPNLTKPPTPDYTESDILRAYPEQKSLDFKDPYEDGGEPLGAGPRGPRGLQEPKRC
ncbi:SH2 domain-containing adapter protein D-like [Sapajus apella]|uniref:SH2 domain-containing adapter protein D-like n=1 Tax=Sapajus apella TaxID=9515 RepID=A0A6J3GE69_SAPAP|nr:SH2 domain-containing adapter protein D-like [Sapajus apella]